MEAVFPWLSSIALQQESADLLSFAERDETCMI